MKGALTRKWRHARGVKRHNANDIRVPTALAFYPSTLGLHTNGESEKKNLMEVKSDRS